MSEPRGSKSARPRQQSCDRRPLWANLAQEDKRERTEDIRQAAEEDKPLLCEDLALEYRDFCIDEIRALAREKGAGDE